MLKGIPASGKSTWAKDYTSNYPQMYKRVNKDEIRAMLNVPFSYHNEKFVENIRDSIILESLKNNTNIIIDDTNLNPKHEKHIKELIRNFVNKTKQTIIFEIKWFHIDINIAIERDNNRINKVGADVIQKMYKQYSGYKNLQDIYETINPIVYPYEYNNRLQEVIIVDVDGTVAEKNNRGIFEWDKVKNDLPRQTIIDLVNILRHDKKNIIFFSGRDKCCYDDTLKWLQYYFGDQVELYMREHNDVRSDTIVKQELFEKHILNKYNVQFVLDDRNKVVDMWRNVIGVTCLQVNYGDF